MNTQKYNIHLFIEVFASCSRIQNTELCQEVSQGPSTASSSLEFALIQLVLKITLGTVIMTLLTLRIRHSPRNNAHVNVRKTANVLYGLMQKVSKTLHLILLASNKKNLNKITNNYFRPKQGWH